MDAIKKTKRSIIFIVLFLSFGILTGLLSGKSSYLTDPTVKNFSEKKVYLNDPNAKKFVRPECYYFLVTEPNQNKSFLLLKTEFESDKNFVITKPKKFFIKEIFNKICQNKDCEEVKSKKYYEIMHQQFNDKIEEFIEYISVLKTENGIPVFYVWRINHKRNQNSWEDTTTLKTKINLDE